MDYLDPKKELRNRVTLLVGYVLISIAIIIGTVVLIYQAYGFGLKNGVVIQNGLVFFSSQPNPAGIYINDQLYKSQTNTSAVLPAGIYHIKITANGYTTWQRTINLLGGAVEHFDYPFLFPLKLNTTKIANYTSAPVMASQSPDRRWLVVAQPGVITNFDIYDLKNPTKAPLTVSLPANLLTRASSSESWQALEWADDNQHLLLKHNYDGKSEYVLLDRINPAQSLNLSQSLAANPTELTLDNRKFDQYYLYDAPSLSLQTSSLKNTTPVSVADHVLAYKTYGSDSVLYITDIGAPAGKVLLKLLNGGQTYTLHSLPTGTGYVLDLTQYGGVLYVAAGAASENKVYIYRDPIGQLTSGNQTALVPAQVLHVPAVNYLSFSDNAQFIVAENGTQFGVYDIENSNGYNYSLAQPLQVPQTHATWMDGDRLTYVSNSKLIVFDYDGINLQQLVVDNPAYTPFFAPDYSFLDVLSNGDPANPGQVQLTQTPLVIK